MNCIEPNQPKILTTEIIFECSNVLEGYVREVEKCRVIFALVRKLFRGLFVNGCKILRRLCQWSLNLENFSLLVASYSRLFVRGRKTHTAHCEGSQN